MEESANPSFVENRVQNGTLGALSQSKDIWNFFVAKLTK